MKKIILIAGLFLSHFGFSQDIASGLILYFPFNGNANDASPNGLNATIHDVFLTTDRAGKENSAYLFDGQTSYIDVPNNVLLNPASFTYTAWIKMEESFFGVYQVFTKGERDDTVNIQHAFTILSDQNRNPSFIYNPVKTGNCSMYYQDDDINEITLPNNFSLNTWVHVAATYTNGTQKIYVNGNLIGQNTGILKPSLSCSSPFTIGSGPIVILDPFDRPQQVVTTPFSGTIDEVRFYSRAITDAEVKKLYELTTGMESNNYLPLNEMVYPNPSADGKFYLSHKISGEKKISVKDLTGKEVASINTSDNFIDISHAERGLYTLQVTTANAVYIGKIHN